MKKHGQDCGRAAHTTLLNSTSDPSAHPVMSRARVVAMHVISESVCCTIPPNLTWCFFFNLSCFHIRNSEAEALHTVSSESDCSAITFAACESAPLCHISFRVCEWKTRTKPAAVPTCITSLESDEQWQPRGFSIRTQTLFPCTQIAVASLTFRVPVRTVVCDAVSTCLHATQSKKTNVTDC